MATATKPSSSTKSSPIGDKPKRSRKPAAPVLENGRIITDRQLMVRWSQTLAQVQRDLRIRVPGAFRVTGGWRISEEDLLKFERGQASKPAEAVVPTAAVAAPAKVTPARPVRSVAS